MTLFAETLILALGIAFFALVPFIFTQIRKYSKFLFLVGTGAMFGICFFDLLPDVFEMGGHSSLYIIGSVWVLYSFLHFFHLDHHEHSSVNSSKALFIFLGSLIAHCFASGMLLAISHGLSQKIASTVFMALIAHKGYEAMMLSSILTEQECSRTKKTSMIACYVLSLPAGVVLPTFLKRILIKGSPY